MHKRHIGKYQPLNGVTLNNNKPCSFEICVLISLVKVVGNFPLCFQIRTFFEKKKKASLLRSLSFLRNITRYSCYSCVSRWPIYAFSFIAVYREIPRNRRAMQRYKVPSIRRAKGRNSRCCRRSGAVRFLCRAIFQSRVRASGKFGPRKPKKKRPNDLLP